MTNAQKSDGVSDRISRPLRQPVERLRQSADRDLKSPIEAVPKTRPSSNLESLATCLSKNSPTAGTLSYCKQKIWFSFFFDGTGNNLNADVETNKHGNVAKLYQAHSGDENNGGVEPKKDKKNFGIYRIYIPGIGTYFRAIGDVGGTDAGLGAGAHGGARLDWALKVFNSKMEAHIALARNPANAIVEVNIAAFGFSRGAALARAFIHDFVAKQCKLGPDGKWILKSAKCPIRIRFLGLFDTVGSVGLAMSANNMEKIDAIRGNIKTHISARRAVHKETRPEVLAFQAQAEPGADPAPGNYNGHADWGDRLKIPQMVEDVRHFIAAHELRNSFPCDSISVIDENGRFQVASTFHEYVYPGVHSDVGGSYRPGEGGKNENYNTKIGLIPLWDMYKFAVAAGTPLLPMTAWQTFNRLDFELHSTAITDFQYYMSRLGKNISNIGNAMNAHMRHYYAWRFCSIARKRKGDKSEADRIKKSDLPFKAEEIALQKKIDALEKELSAASSALLVATWNRDDYFEHQTSAPDRDTVLKKLEAKVESAKTAEDDAKDLLLTEKARMNALPKTAALATVVELYDNQLMQDAQAIYEIVCNPRAGTYRRDFVTSRKTLRPHYKILIDAYENEFIKDNGLKDERIFAFFEKYIHDSLAGFGKDATLPSDPRVVYVGDDEKLKYAGLDGTGSAHSFSEAA